MRTTLLTSLFAVCNGNGLAGDEEKMIDLKVGDTLESKDAPGLTWNSSDHVGKEHIVVNVYVGDIRPHALFNAVANR